MEKGTLEITKEDHDLLVVALRSVPMRGTLETLPKGLEAVVALIKKIQSVFIEEQVSEIKEDKEE